MLEGAGMGDIILEVWYECPYKIGQVVTSPIEQPGTYIEFFGHGQVDAIEKHGGWGRCVAEDVRYLVHIHVNAENPNWIRCGGCESLIAPGEPHHCESCRG